MPNYCRYRSLNMQIGQSIGGKAVVILEVNQAKGEALNYEHDDM